MGSQAAAVVTPGGGSRTRHRGAGGEVEREFKLEICCAGGSAMNDGDTSSSTHGRGPIADKKSRQEGLRCSQRGSFQGKVGLQKFIGSTSLVEGNNLPDEAADLVRPKTFVTDGSGSRSVCQQSSSSFQTPSERPSCDVFSGLVGLVPVKPLNTTLHPW